MTIDFEIPATEDLVQYLALIRAVVLEARLASQANDSRLAADLLSSIENVPDLLTRWSDADEKRIWNDVSALTDRAPRLHDWLERIRSNNYRGLLERVWLSDRSPKT